MTGHILLLSGFWRGEEEPVLKYDLTPAVWNLSHLELLENAAKRMKKSKHSVAVHLKVETGMARLGASPRDLTQMIQALRHANFVMLEGLFTHLASAEVVAAPDVDAQVERYHHAMEAVLAAGLAPIYYHAANSAGIVTRRLARKNMVRPGISLYGYSLPLKSVGAETTDSFHELPVKPVLSCP